MAALPGKLIKMFNASKPSLARAWAVSKVELRPPTPGEIGQAVGEVSKGIQNLSSMKWMNYSVKLGWQNTLVATEVLMWFFVGEIIGRRSIIGYKV